MKGSGKFLWFLSSERKPREICSWYSSSDFNWVHWEYKKDF